MTAKLIEETHGAKVERGFVIDVEAFERNCSQHITEGLSLAEIAPTINGLEARIAEIEAGIGIPNRFFHAKSEGGLTPSRCEASATG
mgnify:CR=1 FL=1